MSIKKVLISFIFSLLIFVFVGNRDISYADETSWKIPQNVGSFYDSPNLWNDAINAKLEDGIEAYSGDYSSYLKANWEFNEIPDNAIIDYITFRIKERTRTSGVNFLSAKEISYDNCSPIPSFASILVLPSFYNLNLIWYEKKQNINVGWLKTNSLKNGNYCFIVDNGYWPIWVDAIQMKATYHLVDPTPTVIPTLIPTEVPSPTPTSAPTQTPTPTPTPEVFGVVAPFLDLPFDYRSQGKKFDDVAMNPESWFDHKYPLQNVLGLVMKVLKYTGKEENDAYRSHSGYDYASINGVKMGTPVLAAAAGEATFLPESKSGGAGNMIKIDHGNGYQTWYEHLSTEDLVVASEATSVAVQKGQQVGKVGMTGNTNGPHIHFSVFKDENNNGTFGDDYPFGLVDPLGWEGNDADPWTLYGTDRHGAASFNLFIPREKPKATSIPTSGGNLATPVLDISVPNGAAAQSFTLTAKTGPFESVGTTLGSVVPSFFLNAINSLGDAITQFFAPVTITYSYADAELLNINEDTLKLYVFDEQTNAWEVLPSTLDKENKTVTAQTSHFSHFALMGEVKDSIAPTTHVVIDGVSLRLDAQDNNGGLGVDTTFYKLDESEWLEYSAPISVEEGAHTIVYQSIDVVGNKEDQKTKAFQIDMTAPRTSLDVVSGTEGAEGWYTSDVTFSLKGHDAFSGVTKTEYSLDGGLTYSEYHNTVTVSSEGENHIYYRSIDKAGNVEDAKDIVLRIDKTAPNSLVYTTGISGSENWYRSNVQIALNAVESISGYKTSYYSFNDDENYTEYTDPIVIEEGGITKINYYSVDNAGNVEESKIFEIKIDKTAPEAKIEYDLKKKDLVITGIDDHGTPVLTQTQLEKNKQRLTITDKAGNTLVLDGIERDRGSNAGIKLFTLSYNGVVTSLEKNRIVIQYDEDKNGKIETFKQVYTVHEGERIKLEYNPKKDKTTITQNKQKTEVPGMKFLQLTTEKGQIKYIYE